MKTRINTPELMDLGPNYYSMEEYYDCLYKLGLLGHFLRSDAATIRAMKSLSCVPRSILDVGCGGGSFTLRLAQEFSQARVVGIDIDAHAITYAQKLGGMRAQPNISFEHRVLPELSEPAKSFDIVTASLVCHHLTDEQIIDFLVRAGAVARHAIVINDLHRHVIACALFKLLSPILRNRLCAYDGLLSIKRAFTRAELARYLQAAGYLPTQYTISWNLLFRWIIVIRL